MSDNSNKNSPPDNFASTSQKPDQQSTNPNLQPDSKRSQPPDPNTIQGSSVQPPSLSNSTTSSSFSPPPPPLSKEPNTNLNKQSTQAPPSLDPKTSTHSKESTISSQPPSLESAPTNFSQSNNKPPPPNPSVMTTSPSPQTNHPSGNQNKNFPPKLSLNKSLTFIVIPMLVVGTIIGILLVKRQQDIRRNAATKGIPQCPLSGSEKTTIITFDGNFIRSDKTESEAKLDPVSVDLKPGNYRITLVSYDSGHPDAAPQPKEKFHLILQDDQNQTVSTTNSIDDLPDDQTLLTKVVNENLLVSKPVNFAVAYHSAFPDTNNPNSINPVCASFELLIEPTPEPTIKPTPEPTPEPSPEPTPEPSSQIGCNQPCSIDNECITQNPNWICYQGLCRHKNNPGDEGCNEPVKITCNSECPDDTYCQQENPDWACINGNCRLPSNPSNEKCEPPTTVVSQPTPTSQLTQQTDLPEAGSDTPTKLFAGFGGLLLLVGTFGLLLL